MVLPTHMCECVAVFHTRAKLCASTAALDALTFTSCPWVQRHCTGSQGLATLHPLDVWLVNTCHKKADAVLVLEHGQLHLHGSVAPRLARAKL
eukprot:4009117-Amphidinium_carterae.1